jgi:hypothetical protein
MFAVQNMDSATYAAATGRIVASTFLSQEACSLARAFAVALSTDESPDRINMMTRARCVL